MERWICKKRCYGENAKVDAFLSELADVCKRHGLSIVHEDGEGSFQVEKFYQGNIDVLISAHDNTPE